MATKQKKYIFVKGVMTLNPEYIDPTSSQPTSTITPPTPSQAPVLTPLVIISSQADVQMVKEAQHEQGYVEEEMPLCTRNAIEFMTTPEYVSSFGVSSERNLFEELCHYFVTYEVPLGLVSKLLVLKDYRLNFMVDDSGSMGSSTDVKYKECTEYIRHGKPAEDAISRWEEAENRLHVMIDILAYIPAKHIQIDFMNNTKSRLILSHHEKSPEMFQQEYHALISSTFKSLRLGGTPTLATLQRGFRDASQYSDPTSHYLLTDGVPSDASVDKVAQLIQHRTNPERNPLTLISCTNVDSECEWMKTIEESAPFTAEIDDFFSERQEVMKDQGAAFPYTKGLWLLSNLIAALNPDDLDALDESVPFTKHTLDELLGRIHSPEEYAYYFDHNPHSSRFREFYEKFATVNQPSRAIIPPQIRNLPPPPPPPSTSDSGGCVVM